MKLYFGRNDSIGLILGIRRQGKHATEWIDKLLISGPITGHDALIFFYNGSD